MSYDDELFSGGSAPSSNDLEAHINANLSEWLRYVSQEPSLYELDQKAEEIMADLRYATAIPSTVDKAIELVVAVDTQFERLGLGQQWYPRLLGLYSPTMDGMPEDFKAHLYRAFVKHYLYRGDLLRANAAVNAILDLTADKWSDALQEAMVGAAAVANGLETGDQAANLARMLVSLAYTTKDYKLLGRSYSVLFQFHADRLDWKNAFVCGQMVYCIGLKTGNDSFILNGMHYMATAFQVHQQYHRAIHYLEMALEYACRTGDKLKLDYMMLTWGTCSYYIGDYEKAEGQLRESIEYFKDSGHYYATALYSLGLCLLSLGRYDESEVSLKSALVQWEQLKRPFDTVYGRHGLAELYSTMGRHDEAVSLSMDALSDAEGMAERAGEFYLKTLRDDVVEYQRRRDAANRTP